jgi:hypothetical protein
VVLDYENIPGHLDIGTTAGGFFDEEQKHTSSSELFSYKRQDKKGI